jgi:hypothetical protein
LPELKRLIDESGFLCDVCKEEVLQERGPRQISIDAIVQKHPHSYKNCRVTQLRFNTPHSYTDEVYNDVFKDYENLNRRHLDLFKKTDNWDELMDDVLKARAETCKFRNRQWMKYFDEDEPPEVTHTMLRRILDRQGGFCAHLKILAIPFVSSPYTISVERINVRLPYLERNMCLVISVMNCIDLSGGSSYWEIKGEGANHYYDYGIIHHESCGWNEQMVKELRDKYSDKNAVGNKRKILVRNYIFVLIYFLFILLILYNFIYFYNVAG